MRQWTFLDYKNRFLRVLDQENTRTTGVYSPVVFPDQTTPIVVPIKINLSQFTRIYSSLTKGADLTYPFDSHEVAWDFLQGFENMVQICAEIINCIENDTDTINALNTFLANYGNGSEDKERSIRENAQQKSDDLLSFSVGGICDKDALFACVSQMISLLHQNNLDALEIIEAQTNSNVELAQVISSITFLDEISIDTVFNYVAFVQNAISENYIASYTDELYDAIRCDIFCLAQAHCGLSIDILFSYFEEKMSLNSIDVSDIVDLITFFVDVIDGTFIGDNVVYFMFYSQLALVRLADSLLTLLLQGNQTLNQANRLNLQIRAFSNDSDPDWLIICEECPTAWSYTFNAVNGWGAIEGFDSNTILVDGVWVSIDPTNDAPIVKVDLAEATTVLYSRIKYKHEGVRLDSIYDTGISFNTFATVYLEHQTNPALGIYEVEQTDDAVAINNITWYTITSNTLGAHVNEIQEIVITGEGFDPFA